jgi:hypothetical protein
MRKVDYLLQSDPRAGVPYSLSTDKHFEFDLGVVGAVAMLELMQTCRTPVSLTEVIRALMAGKRGSPLKWRGNGPGVGWEMRSAWSGLFGRFFARAYLQKQGFTWFLPLERSYNQLTPDLVVTRAEYGKEVADWVCAKSEAGMQAGELAVAEAKGRHREGHVDIAKLPRPLASALEQIDNTFVMTRRPGGDLHPCATKGYAILSRWSNESKGARALLRVVDPETPGWTPDRTERNDAISGIAQRHVSELLDGIGLEGLAYATSPVKEPPSPDEIVRFLHRLEQFIRDKPEKFAELLKPSRSSKEDGRDVLNRRIEHHVKRLRTANLARFSRTEQDLLTEARRGATSVRVNLDGFEDAQFVGKIVGMSGVLETELTRALSYISHLPHDMADQFVFVGTRVDAVEKALYGGLRPIDAPPVQHGRTFGYGFTDGSIVVSAARVEVQKTGVGFVD